MKELVLDIVKNPVVLLTISLTIMFSGLIFSRMSRKYEAITDLIENLAFRFLLLCNSELTLTPFVHWSSRYLVVPPLNSVIAYSQIAIYIYIVILSFHRIKVFVKDELLKTLLASISSNPFTWIVSLWAIMSCLWSNTPFIAFKSGLILLAINLVSLYITSRFQWDEIFSAFRWNFALIALASFVIRRRSNAGTTEGGGLAGILPSKNTLGGLMALGMILCFLYAVHSSKSRALSLLMGIICLVILVQSRSGGAYIIAMALIAISLSILFIKRFRFKYAAIAVSLLSVLTILMSILIFFNAASILALFGKQPNLTGRDRIWSFVLSAISKRLWLGYGVNSFWQSWLGSTSNAFKQWPHAHWWMPSSAHQGFLDVLLQLGIVGLALIILSLAVSFNQSLNYLFTHSKIPSLLPFIVVFFSFLVNVPETRFLMPNAFWISYCLVSIKLSIGGKQ